MKRIIISIILVLLGAGVLLYPSVSNFLSERNGSEAIREYNQKVDDYDEATLRALWDEAELYNENLTGSPVHDPFLEGTGIAMPENYRALLDLDGVMGYIEIPKISVYLPIYHGTSLQVLNMGVGHLEGSTLPIGGKSRHSVLTGHTGLTNARMFTDLTELEVGDQFYIHILGQTLAYQVDQVKTIEPNITSDLGRFVDKDYCTLLTCTPYGVNSHRLLVRGERVDYIPAVKDAIEPVASSSTDKLLFRAAVIASVVMLGGILVTIVIVWRRKKKAQPPIIISLKDGETLQEGESLDKRKSKDKRGRVDKGKNTPEVEPVIVEKNDG